MGSRQGACQLLAALSFRENLCNQRSRRRASDKFGHQAGGKYPKLALGFDAVVTIPTGCRGLETARVRGATRSIRIRRTPPE